MSKEIDQQLFERIEAYIMDSMSAEERHDFELDLKNDPELREELRVQQESTLAVGLGGFSKELKKIRGTAEDGTIPIESGRRKSIQPWLGIAAGFVLLFGLFTWLNSGSQHEQLFAAYYEVDPGLPVPMSANDDIAFHDAMVDFKMGKFALAIEKWSALHIANEANDTLAFYLGCAEIEQGNDKEALDWFSKMRAEQGKIYHKANWYSLLAKTRSGDTAGALAQTIAEDSPFYLKAQALKSKLAE